MVSKTAERAAEVRAEARKAGVTVTAKLSFDYNARTREWDGKVIDAVVTAETFFEPGDARAYMAAESACNSVLRHFAMVRPGSTWGTDSASVGGHAGMTGGYCRMNKSGVEIRLARQFASK
jgi:hypothetical protein